MQNVVHVHVDTTLYVVLNFFFHDLFVLIYMYMLFVYMHFMSLCLLVMCLSIVIVHCLNAICNSPVYIWCIDRQTDRQTRGGGHSLVSSVPMRDQKKR